MTNSREDLIAGLAATSGPVAPFRAGRTAALWLAGSAAYVVLATLALGPLRQGAVAALAVE